MAPVKLNNSLFAIKLFVLILTLSLQVGCSSQKQYVSRIKGKEIHITPQLAADKTIDDFIAPYRNHIDNDLDQKLSYAPVDLDKKVVEMQSTMGNFMADVTLQKANEVLLLKNMKSAEICLLNYGGIRSVIGKGKVTARNAYEVMPFENSAVIVTLSGKGIREIAEFVINDKKAHPISGMSFKIDKSGSPVDITIGGKPLDLDRNYDVVTSDYLEKGGDNMNFFAKATKVFDIEYKLRNMLIDYFKEHTEITSAIDGRIKVEQQ